MGGAARRAYAALDLNLANLIFEFPAREIERREIGARGNFRENDRSCARVSRIHMYVLISGRTRRPIRSGTEDSCNADKRKLRAPLLPPSGRDRSRRVEIDARIPKRNGFYCNIYILISSTPAFYSTSDANRRARSPVKYLPCNSDM
jgi:hypothetical protein